MVRSDTGRIVRFSAGADRDRPAYPIEFPHELGIAPFKALSTLLGVDGAFQQAGIMCREGDVPGFGTPKSRACAIRLSGRRFGRAYTLRLKLAQGVENAGMMGIDDIAADSGGTRQGSHRGRGGWVVGKAAQGFAQACIGICPTAGLRCG